MIYTICGFDYEVVLVDDGTLDTVIRVEGQEQRFSQEMAADWRDETGAFTKEGWDMAVEEAIESYNEDKEDAS